MRKVTNQNVINQTKITTQQQIMQNLSKWYKWIIHTMLRSSLYINNVLTNLRNFKSNVLFDFYRYFIAIFWDGIVHICNFDLVIYKE